MQLHEPFEVQGIGSTQSCGGLPRSSFAIPFECFEDFAIPHESAAVHVKLRSSSIGAGRGLHVSGRTRQRLQCTPESLPICTCLRKCVHACMHVLVTSQHPHSIGRDQCATPAECRISSTMAWMVGLVCTTWTGSSNSSARCFCSSVLDRRRAGM